MSWGLVDIFAPGETERAAELDRRNAELNAQRRSMGLMTQEQSDAQEARFNDNPEANNAAIVDGFVEGAREGAAATADAIKGSIAAPLNFAFRAIPWQLWAVGAVALFLYMGGGVYLRGIIGRK